MSTLPQDKQWLAALMKRLGYRSYEAGVCFGVACMAMQAALVGDLNLFNERFSKLAMLFVNSAVTSDDMIDIYAFFDGVELFQQPYLYPHLFAVPTTQHQSTLFSQSLTLSEKLMAKDGMQQIDRIYGVYSKDDLKNYFSSLEESRQGTTQPFSLLLRSHNHAITVGYDQKSQQWFCVNAACINSDYENAVQYFSNTDEMAASIHQAFDGCEKVAFSTSLYASKKDDQTAIEKVNNAWQKTAAWKNSHNINKEFAERKSSEKGSALHLAILENDIETVKKLLALGADVNFKIAETGNSALHLAALQGLTGVFDLLVANGADLQCTNNDGDSLMHAAASYGHVNIMERLTKLGRDVNARNALGETPLHHAARTNQVAVISYLADKKVNVNDTNNKFHYSPLLIATGLGHTEAVDALLAAHANPNLATVDGTTPVFAAVERGDIKMLEKLLAADADPNLAGKDGIPPLYMATNLGKKDIIQALMAAGADPYIEYNDYSSIDVALQLSDMESFSLLSNPTTRNIPVCA